MTGLHSQVAQQAVTDPLTGLSNRRRLDQLLGREVERAQRFGHELSLLIVDADDFKQINDQHGHLVGDEVLETIADVVRSTTRTIDITARYGGDELALVLLETGAQGATILADRLRENVRTAKIRGLHRGSRDHQRGCGDTPGQRRRREVADRRRRPGAAGRQEGRQGPDTGRARKAAGRAQWARGAAAGPARLGAEARIGRFRASPPPGAGREGAESRFSPAITPVCKA